MFMSMSDIVADLTKGLTDAVEAVETAVENLMSPAESEAADMTEADAMDEDDMDQDDMDEEAMDDESVDEAAGDQDAADDAEAAAV
jgi:hypothetical protein